MDKSFKEEIISLIKEQLASTVADELPIGAIMPFPINYAPLGWLICDGRYYHKDQFPELFESISFTFGKKDQFFRVPDLQGQFIRGLDLKGNVDPERTLSFQPQHDTILGHRHAFFQAEETSASGYHNHSIPVDKSKIIGGSWGGIFSDTLSRPQHPQAMIVSDACPNHTHKLPQGSVQDVISSSYGDVKNRIGNETRPTNIALLYCIKAEHVSGIREYTKSEYNTLLKRLSSDIVENTASEDEYVPIVPKGSKEYSESINRIKEMFFKRVPDNRNDLLLRTGRCFEAICLYNARVGEVTKGFDDTGLYYLVCWMADKGIIRQQEKDAFKEEVKRFFRSAHPNWDK